MSAAVDDDDLVTRELEASFLNPREPPIRHDELGITMTQRPQDMSQMDLLHTIAVLQRKLTDSAIEGRASRRELRDALHNAELLRASLTAANAQKSALARSASDRTASSASVIPLKHQVSVLEVKVSELVEAAAQRERDMSVLMRSRDALLLQYEQSRERFSDLSMSHQRLTEEAQTWQHERRDLEGAYLVASRRAAVQAAQLEDLKKREAEYAKAASHGDQGQLIADLQRELARLRQAELDGTASETTLHTASELSSARSLLSQLRSQHEQALGQLSEERINVANLSIKLKHADDAASAARDAARRQRSALDALTRAAAERQREYEEERTRLLAELASARSVEYSALEEALREERARVASLSEAVARLESERDADWSAMDRTVFPAADARPDETVFEHMQNEMSMRMSAFPLDMSVVERPMLSSSVASVVAEAEREQMLSMDDLSVEAPSRVASDEDHRELIELRKAYGRVREERDILHGMLLEAKEQIGSGVASVTVETQTVESVFVTSQAQDGVSRVDAAKTATFGNAAVQTESHVASASTAAQTELVAVHAAAQTERVALPVHAAMQTESSIASPVAAPIRAASAHAAVQTENVATPVAAVRVVAPSLAHAAVQTNALPVDIPVPTFTFTLPSACADAAVQTERFVDTISLPSVPVADAGVQADTIIDRVDAVVQASGAPLLHTAVQTLSPPSHDTAAQTSPDARIADLEHQLAALISLRADETAELEDVRENLAYLRRENARLNESDADHVVARDELQRRVLQLESDLREQRAEAERQREEERDHVAHRESEHRRVAEESVLAIRADAAEAARVAAEAMREKEREMIEKEALWLREKEENAAKIELAESTVRRQQLDIEALERRSESRMTETKLESIEKTDTNAPSMAIVEHKNESDSLSETTVEHKTEANTALETAIEKETDSLRRVIEAQAAQLEAARANAMQLDAALSNRDARIADMSRRAVELQARLLGLEEQLAASRVKTASTSSATELQRQHAHWTAQLAALEADCTRRIAHADAERDAERALLKSKLSEMEKAVRTAQQHADEQARHTARLVAQMELRERELDEAVRAAQMGEARVSDAALVQRQLAALLDQRQQDKEAIAKLTRQLDDANAEIRANYDKLTMHVEAGTSLPKQEDSQQDGQKSVQKEGKPKTEKSTQKQKVKKRELEQLRARLQEQEGHVASLERSCRELEAAGRLLQARCGAAEQRAADAIAQADQWRARFHTATDELRAQMTAKDAHVAKEREAMLDRERSLLGELRAMRIDQAAPRASREAQTATTKQAASTQTASATWQSASSQATVDVRHVAVLATVSSESAGCQATPRCADASTQTFVDEAEADAVAAPLRRQLEASESLCAHLRGELSSLGASAQRVLDSFVAFRDAEMAQVRDTVELASRGHVAALSMADSVIAELTAQLHDVERRLLVVQLAPPPLPPAPREPTVTFDNFTQTDAVDDVIVSAKDEAAVVYTSAIVTRMWTVLSQACHVVLSSTSGPPSPVAAALIRLMAQLVPLLRDDASFSAASLERAVCGPLLASYTFLETALEHGHHPQQDAAADTVKRLSDRNARLHTALAAVMKEQMQRRRAAARRAADRKAEAADTQTSTDHVDDARVPLTIRNVAVEARPQTATRGDQTDVDEREESARREAQRAIANAERKESMAVRQLAAYKRAAVQEMDRVRREARVVETADAQTQTEAEQAVILPRHVAVAHKESLVKHDVKHELLKVNDIRGVDIKHEMINHDDVKNVSIANDVKGIKHDDVIPAIKHDSAIKHDNVKHDTVKHDAVKASDVTRAVPKHDVKPDVKHDVPVTATKASKADAITAKRAFTLPTWPSDVPDEELPDFRPIADWVDPGGLPPPLALGTAARLDVRMRQIRRGIDPRHPTPAQVIGHVDGRWRDPGPLAPPVALESAAALGARMSALMMTRGGGAVEEDERQEEKEARELVDVILRSWSAADEAGVIA